MLNWMSNYLLLNFWTLQIIWYTQFWCCQKLRTMKHVVINDCKWMYVNTFKKYPSRYLQEPRALSISIWCKGGLDWPGRKGSPAPARYKKYWFTLQSLKKNCYQCLQLSGLQTESSPLVLSLMKVKHIRSPGIGSLKYYHGHSLIDRIH